MKTKYKYGKNFEDILDIKKFYIDEDKNLLNEQKKSSEVHILFKSN